MSTAFYPLGMKSNNNHLPQGGYVSWKGSGVFSNPIGITSTHIRPLTNLDPGNVFPTGFGLARPIKHYRKGRVIPVFVQTTPQIQYNLNRSVASSTGSSLGGGGGGRGLLNELQDTPGSCTVKQNNPDEISEQLELNKDCKMCQGVGVVVNYYPNTTYLTNNPQKLTTTPPLCCNEERKARRRVLPASTLLKKNYYTTLQDYRYSRCQTYDQRVFNFQTNTPTTNLVKTDFIKPGGPLSVNNTYVANCQPNAEIMEATEINIIYKALNILQNQGILSQEQVQEVILMIRQDKIQELRDFYDYLAKQINKDIALAAFITFLSNPYYGMPLTGPSNPKGCKLVVYKPNNYQFAQQGAVSSSTRTLKSNVDTINCNLESFTAQPGCNFGFPFILKSKTEAYPPRWYNKNAYHVNGNPKTCFKGANDYMNKELPGNVHKGIHWGNM